MQDPIAEHQEPRSTAPAVAFFPKVRRPVRYLLAWLGALAVLLFASEMIARRVVSPKRIGFDNWFAFDPDVGFVYTPNYVYEGFDWFGDWVQRPMYTNARGLKTDVISGSGDDAEVKQYPTPRQPGDLRVICFGDSTTNGMNLDSFPEFLEGLLKEAMPGRDVWVQDAGVCGYSSTNVARLAAREIPLFKPDVVIVSVGVNDPALADRQDSDDFKVRSFGEFLARLAQKSRLVTWLRGVLPQPLIQPWQNEAWRNFDVQSKNLVPRVTVEERKENLRRVIALSRKNGALPIIVLNPWLFWNPVDNMILPSADYGPYLEATREVCREENVPLIDMVSYLQRPDRAAFFVIITDTRIKDITVKSTGVRVDNYHLNHAGQMVVAAKGARFIEADLKQNHPDWPFDQAPIDAVFEQYKKTPTSTGDLLNLVPPEEVWRHYTPAMEASNARMEEKFPGILGKAP